MVFWMLTMLTQAIFVSVAFLLLTFFPVTFVLAKFFMRLSTEWCKMIFQYNTIHFKPPGWRAMLIGYPKGLVMKIICILFALETTSQSESDIYICN